MRLAKWGNSLAIRVPKDVIAALGLKEGDEVEVAAAGPSKLEVARSSAIEEALAQIDAMRIPLPPGFKFDREEANARGPE